MLLLPLRLMLLPRFILLRLLRVVMLTVLLPVLLLLVLMLMAIPLMPADPCCRYFRFCRVNPEHVSRHLYRPHSITAKSNPVQLLTSCSLDISISPYPQNQIFREFIPRLYIRGQTGTLHSKSR